MSDKLKVGNYSHQLLAALTKLGGLTRSDDARKRVVLEDIRRAQHFWLPDNGNILPRLGAVRDMALDEVRPPFDCTVLEWRAHDVIAPSSGNVVSSRRVVLVRLDVVSGNPAVTIICGMYLDDHRTWSVYPMMGVIPLDPSDNARLGRVRVSSTVKMGMCPVFPDQLNGQLVGGLTMEVLADHAVKDMADEFNAYFDLCQALQCSNVETEDVCASKVLNAQRGRRGKTALFDYKVLTIPGGSAGEGSASGAAAQRRSHLRRGHIRRLEGGRKVWVNACFVRGAVPGFVHKDYNVEVAA